MLNIGVPHTSTSDDEYDGYFIPKGTIVIGNSWYEAICCSPYVTTPSNFGSMLGPFYTTRLYLLTQKSIDPKDI